MGKFLKIGSVLSALCFAGALLGLLLVVIAPTILSSLYPAYSSPGAPSKAGPASLQQSLGNLEAGIRGLVPILAMLLLLISPFPVLLGVAADRLTGEHKAPDPASGGYAGFWRRFAAYILDSIILNIVLLPLGFAISIALGILFLFIGLDARARSGELIATLVAYLISLLANWLYFAYLESSSWQATIGKKALGIIVTDYEGRRISFGKASIRLFAKILSAITLLIGFLMIGFTKRKQGLHDLLAGTLVVLKDQPPAEFGHHASAHHNAPAQPARAEPPPQKPAKKKK